MTNLGPLKAAIKLVADAVSDGIKASGDATTPAKLADFQNLIPDVLNLIPQIGQISLSGLAPADYAALLAELAVDLAIPQAHTAAIVNASIKLLQDVATIIVPDIESVLAPSKRRRPLHPRPPPPAPRAGPLIGSGDRYSRIPRRDS